MKHRAAGGNWAHGTLAGAWGVGPAREMPEKNPVLALAEWRSLREDVAPITRRAYREVAITNQPFY